VSVLAYHPETGAQVVVDEGQLVHMRASGWMTQAEHDANQAGQQAAEQAAQEQAAQAASVKTAPKEK
jgi:hypothetical protein